MEREIERALRDLAADWEHGAAELAAFGLELLAKVAEAEARAGGDMLSRVRAVARRMSGVRPSMVTIGNWAAVYVAALMERRREATPWAGASAALAAQRREIAVGQTEAARRAFDGADTVVTLSYSSSVARLLGSATAPKRIIVAEARPLLEGRRLFETLQAPGRDILCIADAAIPHFVGQASLVLLGADAVCRDGAAINKTGSLSAALAARYHAVPLYVVADRFKLAPRLSSSEIELEAKPGDEIWSEHPAACRNPYFEAVPAPLISQYIMETGLLAPAELVPRFAEVERLLRRLETD